MKANRRGFALITVLWLITALAALVAVDIGAVRLGNLVSSNRIVLARARWAAEACVAIVQARWSQHRLSDTASVDLGRGTRCSWTVDDPTTRININSTDAEVLEALGCSETFVRAVLERRKREPFQDVGQLSELPGFDTALATMITVQGPGSINLSSASRSILLALPGMSPEVVDRVLYRRGVGRPVTSLDELAAQLSPPSRAMLFNRYSDLTRVATFAPPVLVVRAEGRVDGTAPVATIELLSVPLPERLAVVGRRMW